MCFCLFEIMFVISGRKGRELPEVVALLEAAQVLSCGDFAVLVEKDQSPTQSPNLFF